MVSCRRLSLDIIRKHMTPLEVASVMTTMEIDFLADIRLVETVFGLGVRHKTASDWLRIHFPQTQGNRLMT